MIVKLQKEGDSMNNRLKSFIGMAFTSIIWTSGFLQIRNSLEVVGPFTLIFIRFFIALVSLYIFQKIYRIDEKIDVKDKPRLMLNGIIGSLIYYGISNLTIIYLPTVDSAALSSMQLILMLWAESMFLENIVTPKRVFYVVLATIGGILLMRVISISSASIVSYSLMLIATCFWVMYYIIQIPLLKKYKATTLIKYQSFYAVIATMPFVFIEDNKFYLIDKSYIFSLIYLGVFGIAVCYSLNSYALKNIGPTNTSLLLIFQPIIILFWDLIIIGRVFIWSDYIGLLFILIGVVLMIIDSKKTKDNLLKGELYWSER